MSATIKISTATLTNDQVAQLTAILSQAAATAYEQSQKKGDDAAAATWTGDYMEHSLAASNCFAVMISRMDIDEAIDLCDQYGADPEFC